LPVPIKNALRPILVILLLASGACTEPQGNALRFGLSAGAVTLDPRYATDAVSHRINRLIYERLVDFDGNFHAVPRLARWKVLSPLHYRFTLGEKGRVFHDGRRLTAGDVRATYVSILDAGDISPHKAMLSGIEHIEVINEETIDFHLYVADPLFPGRLAIGILPEDLIDAGHPFHRQPVGSGRMKFLDWPGEDRLRLQRVSDGQIFEFITVRDSTVRVLKLLRGELDLVQNDVPVELLEWLKSKPDIVIEAGRGDTFTYLGFNLRDPHVGRLIVRQAIASALDREAIIRHVLGKAARQAGALLPPDHWSGHPDLDGYKYDPERSRQLLKQAGYDQANPLRITYKTSNNPLRVRLATIIQYQLGQVGIGVDLQSYDWGTFYGDIKSGNFQMYSLSWVGLKMPDIFRYIFHSASVPPAGANRGYYNDEHADALIRNAEIRPRLEDMAKIYRELQAYLHKQLPYVPLWYEDNLLARRRNVTGYTLSADGNYDGLLSVERR